MTKMIGTVNGYVNSTAWIGEKAFHFDGTVKGLVRGAVQNGAKEGTKIKAAFASRLLSNARSMTIIAAAHDDRAFGFWAE